MYSLDGLKIPIARHNEIVDRMASIIYQAVRTETRSGVVEVKVYDVQVERAERYWLVHVPEIDRTTQARSLREVDLMARDLIVLMSDEGSDPPEFQLQVRIDLPHSVQKHLTRAAELREQETHVRQEAAKEARAAARELAGQGLTMRDIGAALGVSHQRVGQLIQTS